MCDVRASTYPPIHVFHCVSAYPLNLGYSFKVAGYSAVKPIMVLLLKSFCTLSFVLVANVTDSNLKIIK